MAEPAPSVEMSDDEADQGIDPTTAVEAIAEARGIGAKIRSQCAELDRRKDMVTATKRRIAELYEDLLCLVDEADQAKLPFGQDKAEV